MGGIRRPFHVREKQGSDFWWADFTIQGKRYRSPLAAKRTDDRAKATQEAGARWLEECQRQGVKAKGPLEADTMTLIVRYVETELAARAKKRGPRYAEIEELRLNLHVLPRFPTVTQITSSSWDTAVEEMHGALKLDTIRKVTISCRLFLKWCARIGAIALVPGLRAPSGEEVALEVAERRAFTRDERDRFLAALDGRAKRIYSVLLYTALRKSALERMLPRWINWQTGYVVFPGRAMKKRKPKSFYLHPLAQKAIREEMEETRDERRERAAYQDGGGVGRHDGGGQGQSGHLREPQNRDHDAEGSAGPSEQAVVSIAERRESVDRPIFGAFDYDGHNGKSRSGVFWTACRKAGIPLEGLTAHHVTRHTAATIAGNDGASLAELMRLGGWDTASAAMRYLHASDEQARKAVERL